MKKSQHRHRDRRRAKAASPYKNVRWNQDRTVKSMQVKPGRVVSYRWKTPKESPWRKVWNSGNWPYATKEQLEADLYGEEPPGTIHEAGTIKEPFREFTDAGLKEKSDGTDPTT